MTTSSVTHLAADRPGFPTACGTREQGKRLALALPDVSCPACLASRLNVEADR